jgi:8-oxo-dGTP diphosphatase
MIFSLFKRASPAVAAGAVIIANNTGRILLQLRAPYLSAGGKWSLVGGGVEPGESPERAMFREIAEETGAALEGKPQYLHTYEKKDFKYHSYLLRIPEEFEPVGNQESAEHRWVDIDDLPEPLHPGMKPLIPIILLAIK